MEGKHILSLIADNKTLFETVKEVILKHFDILSPSDLRYNNEQLGAIVRAQLAGKQAVEDAFKEIAAHKTLEKRFETLNPGR